MHVPDFVTAKVSSRAWLAGLVTPAVEDNTIAYLTGLAGPVRHYHLQCINNLHVHVEGVLEILEDEEAKHREASGHDPRKLEAAAEKARKAAKASRDRQTGRKAAEDALQEDISGELCQYKRPCQLSLGWILLTKGRDFTQFCLCIAALHICTPHEPKQLSITKAAAVDSYTQE